jgi:hypothetical protein
MFLNRVLRKTFGPKREQVIDGLRKLHTVALHNMYLSSPPPPNTIR